MKPLICFDLDNTLIYSDKAHIASFKYLIEKYNLPNKNTKQLSSMLYGLASDLILHKLFPRLDKKMIRILYHERHRYIIKEGYKLARPIKNSPKVLEKLMKNYKVAILSNCVHKEMLSLMKGVGIKRGMYNLALGKDQVKRAKPYPDEIFKAQKLIKHKAVAMVGDSIYDIMAGKKAKVNTIALLTGHHTKKDLAKKRPTIILKNISKVPRALAKCL